MKIALFHNLGPGGGKRHLYEHARALAARGHSLDVFVPTEADEEFLPLAPLGAAVRVFGEQTPAGGSSPAPNGGRLRRIARSGALKVVAEIVWLRRHRASLTALTHLYREIATAITEGGYDVAYIFQCRRTLAPDLLTMLQGNTPTVFCCNDTPRALTEWAPRTEEAYDTRSETPLRRKRLGRWVTPAMMRFGAGEACRFETNTRAATIVVANSHYTRECLGRLTGIDARVCYPGVDTEYFCPTTDSPRSGILSVGALLENKRHDFVIESVSRLPSDRRPDVTIIGYESVIGGAGTGPEGARLERLAAERGVSLRIQRHVADVALRDAYRESAVVAFAPYMEPFGLVSLEASACATPVVGVAEAGVRETVISGETGLLTERDPTEFATALDRLLSDPLQARRLGERGREVATASWTWSRSVDVVESVLRRAASKAI